MYHGKSNFEIKNVERCINEQRHFHLKFYGVNAQNIENFAFNLVDIATLIDIPQKSNQNASFLSTTCIFFINLYEETKMKRRKSR